MAPVHFPWVDVLLARGEMQEALRRARRTFRSPTASPEIGLRRADAYRRLGKTAEAGDALTHVLTLDPDNARAWHGLAKVAITEKRYGDAVDAALEAVSRLYHFPQAHFHLGVALTRLGWADRAEQALPGAPSSKTPPSHSPTAGSHGSTLTPSNSPRMPGTNLARYRFLTQRKAAS